MHCWLSANVAPGTSICVTPTAAALAMSCVTWPWRSLCVRLQSKSNSSSVGSGPTLPVRGQKLIYRQEALETRRCTPVLFLGLGLASLAWLLGLLLGLWSSIEQLVVRHCHLQLQIVLHPLLDELCMLLTRFISVQYSMMLLTSVKGRGTMEVHGFSSMRYRRCLCCCWTD